MDRANASNRSRGPAANSGWRSYSASFVPVNLTGPHPYRSMRVHRSFRALPRGPLERRVLVLGVAMVGALVHVARQRLGLERSPPIRAISCAAATRLAERKPRKLWR